MAPGSSLAYAPASGPGGAHHHFNWESQVKDFIKTLMHYGDYNEMADIVVNLTSLAFEMERLISEEESMYNSVRKFGKVRYDTLRLPHKVVAEEVDGLVKFGQGEGSAYLFDPDTIQMVGFSFRELMGF
ncbi:Fasciclin-like arabinogalactan protein 15 [Abeliophyllum distichum]|uniref:Fasciclin-like arabinogalactan protein 15 n=1 Tax=Abeliophyllum distichum TaxID=126358 RepID=A0ABD1T0X2_9LAMI